ncbi:DUF4232 domain-containing protein [Streptomyces fumanus]|uniref:DUF4232 domain-containing protein n=1 Tax=Streptomyces fumanus TaxID=67302 RepID=UPI0033ECDACF
MTTHRVRRTVRSAALAAGTAALALGLTACAGADGGPKAAGGDRAAATVQSRSTSVVDGDGGAERITSRTTAAGVRPCRGDELLVTAVHRFAGQQGDHLLVTASNEGTEPCWVTSYPAVVLDWNTDDVALPHAKQDAPGGDRHLTLRPGGRAYTAVNLFDHGTRNHTARSFALALRGPDGHVGPYYSVDVKGRDARYRWTEADVLNWNTEKPYDF